jgi:hypothetical protein
MICCHWHERYSIAHHGVTAVAKTIVQTIAALALQVGSSRLCIWCSVRYVANSLARGFPQHYVTPWAHLPLTTWLLISQMQMYEFMFQCCEYGVCLTLASMICNHGFSEQALAGTFLSPTWVCPCQYIPPHQAPRFNMCRLQQDLVFDFPANCESSPLKRLKNDTRVG